MHEQLIRKKKGYQMNLWLTELVLAPEQHELEELWQQQ
jgi:hypothetical protein